jgi:hypothetical protein
MLQVTQPLAAGVRARRDPADRLRVTAPVDEAQLEAAAQRQVAAAAQLEVAVQLRAAMQLRAAVQLEAAVQLGAAVQLRAAAVQEQRGLRVQRAEADLPVVILHLLHRQTRRT